MRQITENAQWFASKLMEHLVVPMFVLDAGHRVMIWNHACEQLTGIKSADIVGTCEHWRAFYREPRPCLADLVVSNRLGDIAMLYVESDKVVELEHGVHASNWCAMPQRGETLYLGIDVRPVRDDEGRIIAVVETLRDMTHAVTLEYDVVHDGLTGLLNRRAFDECLEREWKIARREGQFLSLIMIDIDYFKRYNDTYGHIMGDECLRQVAAAMQAAIRPRDVVVRYGGEEFVVILPDASSAEAALVAERIQARIAALAIPHHTSEHRIVSASMGIAAAVPQTDENADRLLVAADAAMYQAKHAGRNFFSLVPAGA